MLTQRHEDTVVATVQHIELDARIVGQKSHRQIAAGGRQAIEDQCLVIVASQRDAEANQQIPIYGVVCVGRAEQHAAGVPAALIKQAVFIARDHQRMMQIAVPALAAVPGEHAVIGIIVDAKVHNAPLGKQIVYLIACLVIPVGIGSPVLFTVPEHAGRVLGVDDDTGGMRLDRGQLILHGNHEGFVQLAVVCVAVLLHLSRRALPEDT